MKNSSPQSQKHSSRPTSKRSPGSNGRVRKSSAEKRERKQTLEKLRLMVGGDENANQLELVHQIIHYIHNLRQILRTDASSFNSQSVQERNTGNNENMSPSESSTNAILFQLNHKLANMLKS